MFVPRPVIAVIVAFVGWIALPCVALAAEGWPQFQGPHGDGITSRSLPTQWSTESNLVWRSELPGNGWSTPVASGDRIYLTSAIAIGGDVNDADLKDAEHSLSLLIVDASSGELLKQVVVLEPTADHPVRIHAKNSHASPTAVIDGDRIFVHFGYQGTACLTLDGDPIWVNRDLYFRPTHGNGGSPILVDNRLIFTCDGDTDPKVVALDADSGRLAWQVSRPVSATKTFSFCTPSAFNIDGRIQVVAPGSDCVLSLDPDTGETIWDLRYEGYSVIPKPVLDGGLVFLSTGFDTAKLLAIRPTGQGIVTETHLQWQLDKNVPKTPSMIAHEGLVYAISDDGIALCVDGETGDVLYRKRVGGNFSSSPLLAGDHVYFTSEQGATTVIKTGREFEQVAHNELGERTLASLAVLDGTILLRTSEALYRIGD